MDNPQYFSIDPHSPNWSPVHALSFMIYQEAMVAGAHGGTTNVLNMGLLANPNANALPPDAYNAITAIRDFFITRSQNGIVQHIDAATLKTQLTPQIFRLYQSLVLMPQDTDAAVQETTAALTAFLGTPEKARAFMAISREHRAEIEQMIRASGPMEVLEPNHQSCFKSPALTTQLFSIFCNEGQIPDIFQDNSIFGCFEHDRNYEKRYGLKQSSDGTFKLLVNKNDPAVSEIFEQTFYNRAEVAEDQAQRYCTQEAPRGFNYYFGSQPALTRTLLGLGSLLSGIIGLFYLLKYLTKLPTIQDMKDKMAAKAHTAPTKSDSDLKSTQKVRSKEPLILSKGSPARANSHKTHVRTVRTNDKRWGKKYR